MVGKSNFIFGFDISDYINFSNIASRFKIKTN